jgi:hypothetical protein
MKKRTPIVRVLRELNKISPPLLIKEIWLINPS